MSSLVPLSKTAVEVVDRSRFGHTPVSALSYKVGRLHPENLAYFQRRLLHLLQASRPTPLKPAQRRLLRVLRMTKQAAVRPTRPGVSPNAALRQREFESTHTPVSDSVDSTYAPDLPEWRERQAPIFNRSAESKLPRVAQREFGPETVSTLQQARTRGGDEYRLRVDSKSPPAFVQESGLGGGRVLPPTIVMIDPQRQSTGTYAHEYAHYADPAIRMGGSRHRQTPNVAPDFEQLGGSYEVEIPAMVTENVSDMNKGRLTAMDLEQADNAQRGGWIYDHMRRYGPQISDNPQLTPEDRGAIREWMERLRNDPDARRRYEQWLALQGR